MIDHWRQRWGLSLRQHSQRSALLAPEGLLSFSHLGQRADQWRHHYEALPNWQVGRCVALPWGNPWSDLPQLIGLWLAGGVWIAHAHDSCHTTIAQELESGIQGPAEGAGTWCTILFSSGSTGPPKLFVRGWRQALLEAQANAARLNLHVGSHCAMLVNPWFGASSKHLLAALLEGWCQVIGKPSLPLLPEHAELLYATPSQIQALGAAPDNGPRFAWISLTGEACPASLWPVLQSWARPGGQCLNALGATETGVIAEQVLCLSGSWQSFRGVPFDGKEVVVVDEQGNAHQNAGEIGRLQISGDALIEGQLLKSLHTWQLVATPVSSNLMRVLSNDLARWSDPGGLELLGRSNQFLKHHGKWIDVSPLQQALDQHPTVKRCQLLCDSDGLTAWLLLDQPNRSVLQQIAGMLADTLENPQLQPQRLFAVAEFPLNANGKVDLAALQGQLGEGRLTDVVRWDAQQRSTRIQADMDSLDQAELLCRLQSSNLIWCGGGLTALGATCPSTVGLIGIAFPKPPARWEASGTYNLNSIAAEQAELILANTFGELGDNLWIGGFSLPAWLAYAVALELDKRHQPVAGVILLDPVDPFRSTYQWRWRRILARQWRQVTGKYLYRDLSPKRLADKSWRQEVLGQWVEEGTPPAIKGELLVFSSGWSHHLSLAKAQRVTAKIQCMPLSTRRHEDVVSAEDVIQQWRPRIWERISNRTL